jgi:hypothetical protein
MKRRNNAVRKGTPRGMVVLGAAAVEVRTEAAVVRLAAEQTAAARVEVEQTVAVRVVVEQVRVIAAEDRAAEDRAVEDRAVASAVGAVRVVAM